VIAQNAKLKIEVEKLDIPQPCTPVRGSVANPKDSYLIVERRELFKVDFDKIPAVLLAAFYIFDIHYTLGLANVYILLDHHFLGNKLPKEKNQGASF